MSTSDPLTMDNARAAWLLSGVRRGSTVLSTTRLAIRADLRARSAWWAALLAVLVLLATETSASAENGEARTSAENSEARRRAAHALERAEHDDAVLAFGDALGAYEEALRLDPETASAMRAQQRAAALRERSEGGFAPLAALERVRRDPKLASDAKAVDELVRAANGFPPGLVRVEAWMFGAEAYASRLDRPDDAVALWRRIAADPRADEVVASAAARELVNHSLARGDFAAAEEAVRLGGTNVDSKLAKDVRRARRRHRLHLGSTLVLGLVAAAALFAFVNAARAGRRTTILARTRASAGVLIAYALYVGVAGAVLASGFEEGTARPFLSFGAVLVPILFVARIWGAAGAPSKGARAFRAVLCGVSVLGAAFLVLEHVDSGYLAGLGL